MAEQKVTYDCHSTAELNPSSLHLRRHEDIGTRPCARAVHEHHLKLWIDAGLDPEDYCANKKYRVPCDSDKPLKPSRAHSSWHYRNGTPYCDRSREEARMSRHLAEHGNLDGYQYKNRKYLENLPTSVYQITFVDKATYYGITRMCMLCMCVCMYVICICMHVIQYVCVCVCSRVCVC